LAKLEHKRSANLAFDASALPARRAARRWTAAAVLLAVVVVALALVMPRLVRKPRARLGKETRPELRAAIPAQPVPLVHGTRRITFSPGCEEYPSFTPDGRTLVYDSVVDGDYELMALDLATGRSRRLTRERGWDYGGNVSPDGKRVAYLHVSDTGRELRLIDFVGAPVARPIMLRPSVSGFPTWTRDGAVLVGDADRISRWEPDGDAMREREVARLPAGSRVRNVAQFDSGDLVAIWLPPSSSDWLVIGEIPRGGVAHIVEERVPFHNAGVIIAPSQSAYYYGVHRAYGNELARRSLGQPAEMVAGGIAPASGLAFAPDGKQLAYSTCRETSVLARLRPGKPPQSLEPRGDWRDVWPVPIDAHRIVFQSDRGGAVQAWLFDLGKHEARALTAPGASRPTVSADGRWMAWVGVARPGLYVGTLDGGPARRITEDPNDGEPSFTSDGRNLVFGRNVKGEDARIYTVPVAGGTARALTPPGATTAVASPTEDRIVFLLETARGQLVAETNLAGRAPLPLPLPPGEWMNPRFSRDGKKLVLVRRYTEIWEVEVASGRGRMVYRAGLDGFSEVAYAGDGDGYIASMQQWEGDLWLADGDFR
jgi:Tol biopolymer transport system component